MAQSTCYLDKMYIYICVCVFKCKLRENYTQLFRLIFQKKFHSKTQRYRIGNLIFIAVSLPRAAFISLA